MTCPFKAVLALIALSFLSIPAHAAEQQICGGYSSMAADNKDIIAAAAFAVRKQSEHEKKLIKLITISQAEKQVVAGVNYRLTLIVEVGVLNRTVKAVVFQDLKSNDKLISWEPQ